MRFKQRLLRDRQNKMVGGVCAGIANYFDIDPTIIRIIFVVGMLSAYPFFLAYLALWVITPYDKIEIKTNPKDRYSTQE